MQAYFFGRADAIAAILDFKSRARLGRVESVPKGVGVKLTERGGGGRKGRT